MLYMNDFLYKGDVSFIGGNNLRVDSSSNEPANPVMAAYIAVGAIARHIGQHPGKYNLLFASTAHVDAFKNKITILVDDLNRNGARLTIEFK